MDYLIELVSRNWWLALILASTITFIFFKRLSNFFGGKAVEINAVQASELIKQQQAILIDLAEKAVFEKCHIQGAINMPGITFINGTAQLKDVSKPVILLPMKGLFPMPVIQFLYAHDVKKLYLFKGTPHDWEAAGFSVLKK